jgi:hypothetical protein
MEPIPQSSSSLAFYMTYTDETGIWPTIWNNMKEQLNLNFTSIKFKDNLNSLRSLASFNIKMVNTAESPLLNLYIIKLNSVSELKKDVKEKILSNFEKFKNSIHILVMDIENSDSGVKSALKTFEKIKGELKNPELKLLPINPTHGRVNDLISDFLKDFKLRVSTEINSKLTFYHKQVEYYIQNKIENKTALYNYINCKDNLINSLQITDFWEDIQKLCEDDLFRNFEFLNIKYPFSEPFSFLDFNEAIIRKRISEKNLSNLEYQQFLFYQYIRSFRQMKDYRKLNFFLTRIINELPNFKNYFDSKFHFYFWCYQFTCRILTFLKSLKSTNFDDDSNYRWQITIFYNMKKFLRSFGLLVKFEVPNTKIFSLIFNKKFNSENDLSIEIRNILANQSLISNETIENDQNYSSFIKDINDHFDDKSKALILNKIKFLEEYLNILINLDKLHLNLNQNRMSIKIQIEKIPILFVLSKFSTIKSILIGLVKILNGEKWEFILEFINFLLIILINSLDKNEDNLRLILEYLKVKFKKLNEFNKLFNSTNENALNDMISSYINGYNQPMKNVISFEFNDIMDIELNYQSKLNQGDKDTIYINILNENYGKFELKLKNKSKLHFHFNKIIFTFRDDINNKTINYPYFDKDIEFINAETNVKHIFPLNFEDQDSKLFENHSLIYFSDVKFILQNGIEANYKLRNGLKINFRSTNLEVHSKFLNFTQVNTDEINLSTYKSESEIDVNVNVVNYFYYNTLYLLRMQFKNLSDINLKGKTMSLTINEASDSKFNLSKNSFKFIRDLCIFKNYHGENLTMKFQDNIKFFKNKIEFNEGAQFSDNDYYLDIPFLIEDTDFYISSNKKLEIITIIKELNSPPDDNIFAYKETHNTFFQHIFSLSHKLRISTNDNILMQNSISLNLDLQNIKIIMPSPISKDNFNIVDLDILQSLNLIVNLKKNFNEILIELAQSYFTYAVGPMSMRFYYPETEIMEKVHELLNLPYFIKINISDDQGNKPHNHSDSIHCKHPDGIQLFHEVTISVKIRKYIREEVLIMLKLKDNDNWTVVGKSRIIERIPSFNDEKSYYEIIAHFQILPLLDGYVKLPEIDFMEYKIDNLTLDEIKNINSLEFLPLTAGSIIEGNERILKIYSINNCALRLNLI